MSVKDYVTLGRSGLRVSPLTLGTMTFGTEWGWGIEENTSRDIFNRYIDAGGNFIDTADLYTAGTSEKMVGKFITERNLRDRVVLATKFTFNSEPGNPNAGGNGRKNIYRALEGSLKRLQTDYIDLYWLHCWDTVTRGRGSGLHAQRFGAPGKKSATSLFFRHARVVRVARANPCREGRQGAPDRAATGILAGRAHHRARAHSRGAGVGDRDSSVEPAGGSAFSLGNTSAPATPGSRRQLVMR